MATGTNKAAFSSLANRAHPFIILLIEYIPQDNTSQQIANTTGERAKNKNEKK